VSESIYEAPSILTFFVGLAVFVLLVAVAIQYWWVTVPTVSLVIFARANVRRRRARTIAT